MDYKEVVGKIDDQVTEINLRIDDIVKMESQSSNGAMASQSIMELKSILDKVKSSMVVTESMITHARIPVSLARFDRRFGLLLKSQNLRVFLVEITLPIALAVFSVASLVRFFLK
ncbi:hypothetical protein [Pseudomonas yamanorum]|uniref:hypothetical protein n=1 Tax=Pseudomonas yamanorum TaxID=515393 RepID=UPI003B9F6337